VSGSQGEKYHAQGLREIEEYRKGEKDELFAVFYVVFDPTKTYCSKPYATIEQVDKRDVYTITICLAPPQPSTIEPSS
jgi:hypothetical protein